MFTTIRQVFDKLTQERITLGTLRFEKSFYLKWAITHQKRTKIFCFSMTLQFVENLTYNAAHKVYMLLGGVNIKGKGEYLLLGFFTFGKVAPAVV